MKRQTAAKIVGIISRTSFWMIIGCFVLAFILGPEKSPWPYWIAGATLLLMVVGITINVRYNVEEE